MPHRRLFDRHDHGAVREEQAEAPHAPAGEAAQMLLLQQSAGNAAVARMLAGPAQVAREDGYAVEAPSDADFTDSLADSESDSESESESESASGSLDPEAQLSAALAAKIADTGTAGERPEIDDTGGYTRSADLDAFAGSESESTSDSESESTSESESESLSEDAPVPPRAIQVAAIVAAEDASVFSELSADLVSELSSDLSSDASESESAEVSGDEAASSSSSSARFGAPAAPAQASVPAAPPLPAVPASAPAPVKKSATARALKALKKPVKALKKIFKGKKKKDLPTAAQLLADTDAPEALTAADSTASVSVSKPKPKPRRARSKSRSEHSDALSAVMSASTVSASTSAATTLSADDESLSVHAPAAPPGPDPNRAAPVKYMTTKSGIPISEAEDSSKFMNDHLLSKLALLGDMGRFGLLKVKTQDPLLYDSADVTEALNSVDRMTHALINVWGWSAEDVQKYFVFSKHRVQATKVEFIRSEADLKKYVVHAGSTMTYGDPPQVFDTGNMISKASGAGFAIFVMDPKGNIFAGQHRVGLFHHSSFTAGTDVAAAGELKVTAGKLVQLTSKSGHYMPTPEHTWQVVRRMASLGVSLTGTEIKTWVVQPGGDQTTNIYDGEEFLQLGPNAPVKRTGGKF